jgi:hypothetical protein
MVELGLRTSTAENNATGAMSHDVHVRVFDSREHAFRHQVARWTQFGMHARDDDVECREHVRALIEGSILVDVTRKRTRGGGENSELAADTDVDEALWMLTVVVSGLISQ